MNRPRLGRHTQGPVITEVCGKKILKLFFKPSFKNLYFGKCFIINIYLYNTA